jgi:hypothetical protein
MKAAKPPLIKARVSHSAASSGEPRKRDNADVARATSERPPTATATTSEQIMKTNRGR